MDSKTDNYKDEHVIADNVQLGTPPGPPMPTSAPILVAGIGRGAHPAPPGQQGPGLVDLREVERKRRSRR